MLTVADIYGIRSLRARGWSERRIAQELGIVRKTVKKYVEAAAVQPRYRGGVATADITTGLPRVEQLLENVAPSDRALVAPLDGMAWLECYGDGRARDCNITPRASGQTSFRPPGTRDPGQSIKEAKQMTESTPTTNVDTTTGAASPMAQDWSSMDWYQAQRLVRRLQARIVQATQAGRWGKVKALQHVLTHSYSAKVLAVRRVTENHGKHTPGVDGVTGDTPEQTLQAVHSLRQRGYRPQPLRRLYIPKSTGKMRPLSIATLRDRAMQTVYLQDFDKLEGAIDRWIDQAKLAA